MVYLLIQLSVLTAASSSVRHDTYARGSDVRHGTYVSRPEPEEEKKETEAKVADGNGESDGEGTAVDGSSLDRWDTQYAAMSGSLDKAQSELLDTTQMQDEYHWALKNHNQWKGLVSQLKTTHDDSNRKREKMQKTFHLAVTNMAHLMTMASDLNGAEQRVENGVKAHEEAKRYAAQLRDSTVAYVRAKKQLETSQEKLDKMTHTIEDLGQQSSQRMEDTTNRMVGAMTELSKLKQLYGYQPEDELPGEVTGLEEAEVASSSSASLLQDNYESDYAQSEMPQ